MIILRLNYTRSPKTIGIKELQAIDSFLTMYLPYFPYQSYPSLIKLAVYKVRIYTFCLGSKSSSAFRILNTKKICYMEIKDIMCDFKTTKLVIPHLYQWSHSRWIVGSWILPHLVYSIMCSWCDNIPKFWSPWNVCPGGVEHILLETIRDILGHVGKKTH